MPSVSIVVPVHDTEPYLRQCLDSLLGQDGADLEVLAVDDASTDGSLEVLHGYAASDARVRVLTLPPPASGGPGAPRNAGMDAATGDWLMFVDSDDWLPAGSVAAALARAEQTAAQLVVFDFRFVWASGRTEPGPNRWVLDTGSGGFTLREHPELLRFFPGAPMRLWRRDFVTASGLRFPPGFYEDLPWTYPLMALATRIAVCDRVCYCYRRRDELGNMLHTPSPAHADVLVQWDRVQAFLDAHPELADLRPALFDRMLSHGVYVLTQGGARLPDAHQRVYFDGLADRFHRYRPPGFTGPYAVRAARAAMLERRSLRGFRLVEQAARLRRAARGGRGSVPA